MASKGEDPDELRLLLVGCTLAGKSATGNSILLKKLYSFEERNMDGTGVLATDYGDPLETGRRITIIDTPEISEAWLNSYTIEGKRFMDLVHPGPHAFLLIVSVNKRFDKMDEEKVNLLQKILGKECTQYMIVVFTNIDRINMRGSSDWKFCDLRKNRYLDSLLKQCNERHVMFNSGIDYNKSEDNMKAAQKQTQMLLTMVNEMVNKNDDNYYPIETVKMSEDSLFVRMMKRFIVVAHRGAPFVATFAAGVGFFHVIASVEDSFTDKYLTVYEWFLKLS